MTGIMRYAIAIVVAGLVGCSQPRPHPIDPGHNRPLSVAEHEAEAQRHDRVAAEEQAIDDNPEATRDQSQPMRCYDRPLAPNPTSGTETLSIMRPCWTASRGGDHAHRAAVHRKAARDHRQKAAELLGAERRSCAGLGEDEIAHSPFFHREDIVSVVAYREGAELRGAIVGFRKVPGLDAAWLRSAIACHQARAAVMGYSRTYMKYCPLMVGTMSVTVREVTGGYEVTMGSDDRTVAAAILGRAEDLRGGE